VSIILIFDDNKDERDDIVERLHKTLKGNNAKIEEFDGSAKPKKEFSYERFLLTWLNENFTDEDISLVVCDKELGLYDKYRGLSATQVSQVAIEKGIPFCQYSRQANEAAREMAAFLRLKDWDSEEITLQGPDPGSWVPQIVSLFNGFEQTRTTYTKVSKKCKTPAATLATILKHPESESRIALYSSGDQGLLKEILVYYNPENPDIDALRQRMPRVLGKWLFLSILRFPGIFVNQVAAASYLNIGNDDFKKPKVQNLFSKAKYAGPFADSGPWWWRHILDDILDKAKCEDGKEFAVKQKVDVQGCLDPDSNDQAGYYCMLTKSPVSAENSRGGISWFPSGADLARIRKDKFEEITALVGMY
jgi:hypothetical protein